MSSPCLNQELYAFIFNQLSFRIELNFLLDRVWVSKPWIPFSRPKCWTCSARLAGRRWSSAGTILILDLVAGCLEWILTPNKVLKLYRNGPLPLSLIPFRVLKVIISSFFIIFISPIRYSALISGKVVIDAFRLINPNMMVLGQEPRQTTSNLGHLQKPSIQV